MKVNDFGKEIRKIRIDNDEILKDMADKLNVTPAYLSQIENSKRAIPTNFFDKIKNAYKLSEESLNKLKNAYEKNINRIKIELSNLNSTQKDAVLLFARKIDEIDDEQLNSIKKIIGENAKQ
ncbi:MAG: helix-turn-helix domain-containing protein [Oscillospiraceae bacterium]|jgi:transcriptional regulator with XRE-family HTH domain|nr:helix-turn-helix domain-containing protein [Oscillospiraceae bacterium]